MQNCEMLYNYNIYYLRYTMMNINIKETCIFSFLKLKYLLNNFIFKKNVHQ